MALVETVHWNPSRPVLPGRLGRLVPWRRPLGNFGDLLGPIVVAGMLARLGIPPDSAPRPARLLAVGSILHFARDGDTVWGAGVNGKVDPAGFATRLDVRSVRGPRTRAFLAERGIPAPEVYGDPALLLPELDPRLRRWAAQPRHEVTVVPNFRDAGALREHPAVISPTAPVDVVLERIARSRLVVGSSLHGIVIAESLGIPARLVAPGAAGDTFAESPLKYEDHYLGTGRDGFAPSPDVESAIAAGGEPPPVWDPAPLLAAFPAELWAPVGRTAADGSVTTG